jgi:hypothetical protein
VIVAVTLFVTAVVLTVKFTEVAPAGTVTLDCTVASVLFDERVIPTPPTAAGPDRVIVPVDFPPPVTDDGDKVMDTRAGGLTVSTALLEVPLRVPVIVTVFVL